MPTTDGQLFMDEFIGEVISIDRLVDFRVISRPNEAVVAQVSFGGGLPVEDTKFTGVGRTMGFALADVREQIRQHYGR